MRDIDVNFVHWRCELPDGALSRYGSPHFDRKSAGEALVGILDMGCQELYSSDFRFAEDQIISANEAFPEAAVADPVADLEIWEEWNSGIRTFPYPGKYSGLGVTSQPGKTAATTSVGVIGEIMAGLFAQAGIAPWILVRPVRRWPDFILRTGDRSYAFVESKATADPAEKRNLFRERIPCRLLWDCLIDAVHQLNADPNVTVWGAFTRIRQVTPMKPRCHFLRVSRVRAGTSAISGGTDPPGCVGWTR